MLGATAATATFGRSATIGRGTTIRRGRPAATIAAASATIAAVTTAAASASPLGPVRNACVWWLRSGWQWLGVGHAFDANNRIFCATAKKAAAFAFVENDEFDLISVGTEFGERLIKGVFDGFAACFGLIHWRSSILERVG